MNRESNVLGFAIRNLEFIKMDIQDDHGESESYNSGVESAIRELKRLDDFLKNRYKKSEDIL
jgi:hypothetical protein|tara:strand:+ start:311 stop:496 length:186 start_codon:yes stop_codon:yes gene_type:complete